MLTWLLYEPSHLNPWFCSPYMMVPHWSQKVLLGLYVWFTQVCGSWF